MAKRHHYSSAFIQIVSVNKKKLNPYSVFFFPPYTCPFSYIFNRPQKHTEINRNKQFLFCFLNSPASRTDATLLPIPVSWFRYVSALDTTTPGRSASQRRSISSPFCVTTTDAAELTRWVVPSLPHYPIHPRHQLISTYCVLPWCLYPAFGSE